MLTIWQKNAKFSDDVNEGPMSNCPRYRPQSGCDVDVALTFMSLCFPRLVPVPKFTLAVNRSTKSFNVTVESDKKVKALWCYRIDDNCMVDDSVTTVAVRNPPRHLRLPSRTLGSSLNATFLCFCFRSIHRSPRRLFSASLTFCPACVCRYFLKKFFLIFNSLMLFC